MSADKQASSLKALFLQGEAKKTDSFRVPLDNLEFESGFNLRDEGPELESHIESMVQFIMSGGTLPPLEVRVSEGRVLIVEGHCRTRAYRKARELGAAIDDISVIPFKGNDAERVVKMIASSQGKALTPIETAHGYRRLEAFNLTPEQIGGRVGKTRQHVEQLLILAHANSDVHAMVSRGLVSAAIAIDAVRKHGEKAGEFLLAEHDKAKAAGRTKITAKTLKPWTPPAKLVASLTDELDAFVDALPTDARTRLVSIQAAAKEGRIHDGQTVNVPAAALLALLGEHEAVSDARKKVEERARMKAEKAAQAKLPEEAAE